MPQFTTHSGMTLADIHSLVHWEHVDSVQRAAETLASADLGKVSHQLDIDGYFLLVDLTPTWTQINSGAGAGSGDVVGPATATADALCVFNGSTGKVIKDSTGTIAQIDANTAKATNATHTGDVTGDTALTIAAGAVDVPMLANGTDGELITWDAAGVPDTVAVGTSGHVLTSGGTGVAPTFQAPPSYLSMNFGGRYALTVPGAGVWGGFNESFGWLDAGANALIPMGSGAVPSLIAGNVLPIVPIDGTIVKTYYHIDVSITTVTGVATLVRMQTTNDSATVTTTLIGSGADLSIPTSSLNVYHTTEDLSIAVNAGDKIGFFAKADTNPAIVVCAATVLIQVQ